ncbi:DUF6378 domain-containing protein [Moraxella sp. ZY200743]|uniref:DUF6378 domain-containing protein n=1 Tax=Moraxella sp. ZY200743 TaxID=2911970 RepID=UPI003D7C9058
MSNINEILEQRRNNYGTFNHVASIAEQIAEACEYNKEYRTHSMNMAIYMIASKLARIVSGNPSYKDSWVDIAGYAQLIVNELENNPK